MKKYTLTNTHEEFFEFEPFLQNEIDTIVEMVKNLTCYVMYYDSHLGEERFIFYDNRKFDKRLLLSIYKYQDEWFYVEDKHKLLGSNWIKCDQFDGLIECLIDVIKTYKKTDSIYKRKMRLKYNSMFEKAELIKESDSFSLGYELVGRNIHDWENNLYVYQYHYPKFTLQEWQKIYNFCQRTNQNINQVLSFVYTDEDNQVGNEIYLINGKKELSNRIRLRFYKLEDEWFYIRHGDLTYRCDQMDGLLNCIKMLLSHAL